MIGIIVTGHGSFATGLTSGLKLLAGEPRDYEIVDFDPEESVEVLTGNLKSAIDRLNHCGSILILADLQGGSPYNVSVRLKLEGKAELEVIGGASLPILLDAYMSREVMTDAAGLAGSSLEAGKAQTIWFQPEESQGNEDDDDEIEFD